MYEIKSSIDTYEGETEDILKKIKEAGENTPAQYEDDFRAIMQGCGMPEKGIEKLISMGFCKAPASTRYHGNYAGGLFEHSVNVTDNLIELTQKMGLKWQRRQSPVIIGMLHDLCKVDQYDYDLRTNTFTYNDKPIVTGHAVKSIIYIQHYGLLELTDEEVACILYHMGAFPPEDCNNYTKAIHKFPNVLWTHTADMMAAHIQEVEDGKELF